MNNKLSEKPWGDVDKDELLKFVINHPKMADKIYLKIEKDWQDNPREKLSYPIADKNCTVYRYGLSSALTYAKANNETEVIKKVKALYKKYNIMEDLCIMEKQRLIIEGLENNRIDESKVTEGFQMTFGASICKSGKKLFATNYDTCVVYEAIDVENGKKDGIIITNEYNGKAKFGAWLSSSEIDDFKKLLNKF